jgi:hypothetical protein
LTKWVILVRTGSGRKAVTAYKCLQMGLERKKVVFLRHALFENTTCHLSFSGRVCISLMETTSRRWHNDLISKMSRGMGLRYYGCCP